MAVHIVRLGTPRLPGEGLRIGTVRRPPRGIPRTRFAADDWYDVWLPQLSPSPATIDLARSDARPATWKAFARRFRSEMAAADAARTLDLLAALSHQTDFSVGCYCADEAHCHRSILRRLLEERGAMLA